MRGQAHGIITKRTGCLMPVLQGEHGLHICVAGIISLAKHKSSPAEFPCTLPDGLQHKAEGVLPTQQAVIPTQVRTQYNVLSSSNYLCMVIYFYE